jgi:hypothetical protein
MMQRLWNGPYPWSVKQRIASSHGHLSNRAAADLAAELFHRELAGVVLAHLSDSCNEPAMAHDAVEAALSSPPGSAECWRWPSRTTRGSPSTWTAARPLGARPARPVLEAVESGLARGQECGAVMRFPAPGHADLEAEEPQEVVGQRPDHDGRR